MRHYVTFHKILDLLEQYQQQSPILNSFGYGNLVDFGKSLSGDTQTQTPKYPYMFVVPQTVEYNENTTTYGLTILFSDILNTDVFNEKDAVSVMSLEARRFISYVKRGYLMDEMDIQMPVQGQPFMERMSDHTAGIALTANIIVFEDINACDYYEEGYLLQENGSFLLQENQSKIELQ
jgi:hypothetical protein